MSTLILLRGLPGAGKSTLARSLSDTIFEADQYWGCRKFDPKFLKEAHDQCFYQTAMAMDAATATIVVANTFTTERELGRYVILAKKRGYTLVSLIVENRHGNVSIHNVPEDTMQKMEARFTVKLR
jgi:predicted kinase